MTLPQSNIGKDAYNKFLHLPEFSYNAIEHLLKNNEIVWKLLKYTDPNAWKDDSDHPNLTQAQKGALIYAGQEDASLYRVFLDPGQDDVFTNEVCLIRISPYEFYPENRTVATVNMMFEVYCHYKINSLSDYQTRVIKITQQFIEMFNGKNIGGIGNLYYDRMGSQSIRSYLAGQLPFRGMASIFSTKESS